MSEVELLKEILSKRSIKTLFQPIIDLAKCEIWGYEALSRGPSNSPLHSPIKLFQAAEQYDSIKNLEAVCTKKAAQCYREANLPGRLFVNLSHEVLIAGSQLKNSIVNLMFSNSIDPSQVVIELTERSSAEDTDALIRSIEEFRKIGFEIAIDDLGTGYSALQLWSEVKPDYVKIDRHFISGVDIDNTKQEFVRSIYSIAQSAGTLVIAEGVETKGELEVLKGIGLTLFQGFLFARPARSPAPIDFNSFVSFKSPSSKQVHCAGKLVSGSESVESHASTYEVVKKFQNNVCLNSIVIIDDQKPVGILHRKRFLTEMSKPYAMDLATNKQISMYMDQEFLQIDQAFRLEQVSRLVTSRARIHAEEDFIVTQDGNFLGTGQVIDLLRQITEVQVKTARHANPLTMLPGNVPIGDCVNELIQQNESFVVSYFDLDCFKPFNDAFGYAKGDEVLLMFADLLKQYLHKDGDFVGHIGGDDFIAVTKQSDWMHSVFSVISQFSRQIQKYYDPVSRKNKGIEAIDRFGKSSFFGIMGVSVGALSVTSDQYQSFQEVSSGLAKMKHLAKSCDDGVIAWRDEVKVAL